MSNHSDGDFLTGMLLGTMLGSGKKSGGNSGCLCVILAVVAIPAIITWLTLAA